MLQKIPLKFLVGAAIFLFAVLFVLIIANNAKKTESVKLEQKAAQEASVSEALLLDKNLQNALNVHRVISLKRQRADTARADTLSVGEIWLVPNGMSIPNYMLRASKEIERCRGKVNWMREIRNGKAALLKYEGEQGSYPLTEVRIVDTLWRPNSSKLAVVLAVREQNRVLRNNPEILRKLDFAYNLLIPSSRPELLGAGKKTNAHIIPWVPMESRARMIYDIERKSQIPIGVTSEKELIARLDGHFRRFDNVSGFAALHGEDFLIHQASVDLLENVLASKKMWFWDLTARGTASLLPPSECAKKGIRCRKNLLEAESESQVKKALEQARQNGKAILLFELTERSINLLENLQSISEKQGTNLVYAGEVF
ncbi:MAG: divergent polysaccharide deacetylase family protein [Fibromonadales bacterium]|nr:divergent polysaccharide deacetylase family protein [Fibromonadales bacterium]